jgi:ankyrin repeat protein
MMASHMGYEEIVKLLVKNGADIDIADKFGKKAYDRAKN